MANSNIATYENSVQDGQPIECYTFMYNGVNYFYTSHCTDVELKFTENGLERTEKYFADYIERQTIKPSSNGDASSMVVSVSKDHPVAKLFQGPPPEKPVKLKIYRLHEQDHTRVDVVFYGRVSQAAFEESTCKLTAKLEHWLSKELPNGDRRFYCNNIIFDNNCQLKKEDWQVKIFIDKVDGLNIYSTAFANYPDGYFEGGCLYFDSYVRMINEHVGNRIRIKYPFVVTPRNEILVTPGCDQLFKTCAKKFNNTLNFTGCPYVAPTDPEKKSVGKGVYWVDSQVVQRDTKGFVGTIDM